MLVLLEDSLRGPWMARRSNQCILKEINPECSLEGLMVKLKLQHFGHLMLRADSLEKALMLGKIEGNSYLNSLQKISIFMVILFMPYHKVTAVFGQVPL